MNEQVPLIIDAGVVFTPTERFAPGRVIIHHGLVEAVGLAYDVRVPAGAARLEAPSLTVAPGFIDPHVHGCGGVDLMDATHDALNTVSRVLARHGTTSFLPTTVSSPADILGTVIAQLGSLIDRTFDGAQPVGIHLEGPFINNTKRGTHRADKILPPNPALLSDWIRLSAGQLKLLTLAPELSGADELIGLAEKAGIRVAMGHSNASYEEALAAIERGVCYAVHTFNAMREFTHRDPGITGAVLADDRIFAEIIADGVHVHPEVVKIFARVKQRDRVLLVTDATSATGMADGQYLLGKEKVNVVNGVCRDAEGRLAGSTLTQEVGLRNFMDWTGATLQDALFGVTLNPALALQLEGRGRIEPGNRADFVVMNDQFQIVKTFVAGKLVFERQT